MIFMQFYIGKSIFSSSSAPLCPNLASCAPTKSNLQCYKSLAAILNDCDLHSLFRFKVQSFMSNNGLTVNLNAVSQYDLHLT